MQSNVDMRQRQNSQLKHQPHQKKSQQQQQQQQQKKKILTAPSSTQPNHSVKSNLFVTSTGTAAAKVKKECAFRIVVTALAFAQPIPSRCQWRPAGIQPLPLQVGSPFSFEFPRSDTAHVRHMVVMVIMIMMVMVVVVVVVVVVKLRRARSVCLKAFEGCAAFRCDCSSG
jgi:hypothetical protein